jgi:hypothetical protein
LAGVAQQIATGSPGDDRLVARAVEAASSIPDEAYRSQALAGIAQQIFTINPSLADELAIRAIDAATAISDDDFPRGFGDTFGQLSPSGALAGIAQQIATGDPSLAVDLAAQAIGATADAIDGFLWWRGSETVADIALKTVAANSGDEQLVVRAIDVAKSIPYDPFRSDALAKIAEQIVAASPGDERVVARAIDAAGAIPDDASRSAALLGIAQQVATTSPSRSQDLMALAIDAAASIPDRAAGSQMLARIAGSAGSTTLWLRAAQSRSLSLTEVTQAAYAFMGAIDSVAHLEFAIAAGIAMSTAVSEFVVLSSQGS